MAMNDTFSIKEICFHFDRNSYTKGFWYGENPLDNLITLSMFQMFVFSIISQILYIVLRPLKQPKVVCNLLGGFLLGPSVLGRYNPKFMEKIFPDKDMLKMGTYSTFSMILFVFVVTVKTDKKMVLRTARGGWILGLFSFFLPFGTTFTLVSLLKNFLPGIENGILTLILSCVLSTSFLSDISHLMDELKLLNSELGQIAMSSAMISDVIGWTLLAGIIILERPKSSHVFDALGLFCVFLIIAFYAIKPTLLWIIKTTPEGKAIDQEYFVAILIQAFIMGTISDALGLGYLPGIMVMGLIIPNGPPLGAAITEKAQLIGNQIFLPFFYLRLGRFLNIHSIRNWKEFSAFLLIVISVYIAKFLAVCLHSIFNKVKATNVIVLGLILNLQGELKFIYFIRFFMRQRIDDQSFVLLTLTHVTITAMATPLIKYLYKPHLRLETTLSAKLSTMSLQSTPMIGELRIIACVHSEDDVHGIFNLLEASDPSPVTTICTYAVHLIELVGGATPIFASYGVKKKLGNKSTHRIMRAFTNYSKASKELVMVQGFISIAPYKTMYESICRLAQSKHVPLIIVPFHKSQIGDINANLRDFNMHMQHYSPCTVGILVQKDFCVVNSTPFSINVAVLFIGGADDREALALATRMSGHPGVKLTLMRIILVENNQRQINELEQQLDQHSLEQFKHKTQTKDSIQCLDIQIHDSLEIFSRIRAFDHDYYDLVIVGKRPRTNLRLEGNMASWAEYPELGMIGDMVASQDFRGGMVSVLAMQHCLVGAASKLPYAKATSGHSTYSSSNSFSKLISAVKFEF